MADAKAAPEGEAPELPVCGSGVKDWFLKWRFSSMDVLPRSPCEAGGVGISDGCETSDKFVSIVGCVAWLLSLKIEEFPLLEEDSSLSLRFLSVVFFFTGV